MEILKRLNDLVGTQGNLPVCSGTQHLQVPFTVLAVKPAVPIMEADDESGFQSLVSRSRFLVKFDGGRLIDGSSTWEISGSLIASIEDVL